MRGELCSAQVSLAGDGSKSFTPSDFVTTDGNPVPPGSAVVIRDIIFSGAVDINRMGDPDEDGTFEISVTYVSEGSNGERHSENRILTQYAGLEIVDTSGASNPVTVIGLQIDPAKVIVEQTTGLADGSELARTIASHGSEETLYEIVHSADYDLERRHDPDDDGTFETDTTVESRTGAGVKTGRHHLMKDESGRSNPEMEIAVLNDSGGTGDYILFGTIGLEL